MNLPARIAQWFHGIKSRRQSAAPLVGLPAIPQCPEWTAHDRDWWKAVLNHETGRKLIDRMRAVEAVVAIANAKDQFHTQHSAGVTAGYSQAVKHLLSLASSCKNPEPAKDRTEPERETDEYLARVSP